MICEICGKRRAVRTVIIEGAKVEVCEYCAGSAEVEKKQEQKPKSYRIYRPIKDMRKILENYMKSNSLSLKDLASKIKISENDMRAILEGRLIDKEKIRRLEKITGITLIEQVVISDIPNEERKEDRIKLEELIDGK